MTLPLDERVDVFARILAAPFDLDAQRRTVRVCDGLPDRTERVWLPLVHRWAQWHLVARGGADEAGPPQPARPDWVVM